MATLRSNVLMLLGEQTSPFDTISHDMATLSTLSIGSQTLNGQLRGEGDSLLEDAVRRENAKCSETDASSIQEAFIPVVVTTAGQIHGEFL